MRFQFSIRTALVAVALLAPICFYIADYLTKRQDFVLPTPTEYSAWLKMREEQMAEDGIVLAKKKASVHAQALVARCPPLGIDYWEARAKEVEPGMHDLALTRQVPNANIGTSFLLPGKGTQVIVYAVDSELAAICEVAETGVGPNSIFRVVKFHGFAKHNLAFDEWNSLDAKELTFDADDKVHVVFGSDGT